MGPVSYSGKNDSRVSPQPDVMLKEGVYTNDTEAALLAPNRFNRTALMLVLLL